MGGGGVGGTLKTPALDLIERFFYLTITEFCSIITVDIAHRVSEEKTRGRNLEI